MIAMGYHNGVIENGRGLNVLLMFRLDDKVFG